MKNLDIKGPQVSHVNEDSDPIDFDLNKYVDHSSILKINKYFNEPIDFDFWEVILNDIEKEIKDLNLDSLKILPEISQRSVRYM